MKHWSIVAAVSLAAPAAFAAEPASSPTAAFKGLPLSERNLAVYDAYWENIENNHYDRQMLSRAEVRALREQGRREAAALERPAHLYGQVFSRIAGELPEAQVAVEMPRTAEQPAAAARFSKSPEEAQRLADLLFSGPGFEEATLRRGKKSLRVVTEVTKDSPADQAGIRPGWRIVNAHSSPDDSGGGVRFMGEFLPLDPVAARAWERGDTPVDAPDSSRVLKIAYAHRLLPARQPVEHRRVARNVSYLRFDGFGDEQFMRPVYQALNEAGPDGLIIDLRWNRGGIEQATRKVAGVLLGPDVTIGYRQDAAGAAAIQTARPARQYQGPLVVLIGPTSSSSSEILAAAIQDHRRGKLVGRMTNGSLLASDMFALPDGGLMTVPTRDFRSPTHRKLDGVGVAPDVRVLPTLEDVRAGRDPAIERAVLLIAAGSGGAVKPVPSLRLRRGELFPPI